MPCISTKTNVTISSAQEDKLRSAIGKAIELIPGKSEKWLMLEFEGSKAISFAGTTEACAMISTDVYGHADPEQYAGFTEKITDIVSSELHIPPDRIYVAYSQTEIWGWAGRLF